MKKMNETIMLSVGNAISLMVFIDLAYYIEKQRGMLSLAFSSIDNRRIYKMLKGFGDNETYSQHKDQLLGMSERFFNNSGLKELYKTLLVISSKQTPTAESDARMQDINRVLSKIERMINSKLTSEEKELFSSMKDTIDNYSDSLNSSLNSSIQTSISMDEPKPEETPEEEPKPEEKPKEKPKPEEKPKEKPKPEETPEEEPKEKAKTEEQFKSLIKRLVKETLRDYEKKFGKL